MKINIKQEYSVFFWLISISLLGIFIYNVYEKKQEEQIQQIKESIENIYLKKTLKEITKNLEPRYTDVYYISKAGDTYESIVNKLEIEKKEKKIILKTILKEKSLKILKINNEYLFKELTS